MQELEYQISLLNSDKLTLTQHINKLQRCVCVGVCAWACV